MSPHRPPLPVDEDSSPITAYRTKLLHGLFCIAFVIVFSCYGLFVTLPYGQLKPKHLLHLHATVFLFTVTSSSLAFMIVAFVLPFCYRRELVYIATFLSMTSMAYYFVNLTTFGAILISLHFNSSSFPIDPGSGTIPGLVFVAFFFVALLTFSLIHLLLRRTSKTPEIVLLRAVAVGSTITVVLYAIGVALQCISMLFDKYALARYAAVHLSIIFCLISMYQRGVLPSTLAAAAAAAFSAPSTVDAAAAAAPLAVLLLLLSLCVIFFW